MGTVLISGLFYIFGSIALWICHGLYYKNKEQEILQRYKSYSTLKFASQSLELEFINQLIETLCNNTSNNETFIEVAHKTCGYFSLDAIVTYSKSQNTILNHYHLNYELLQYITKYCNNPKHHLNKNCISELRLNNRRAYIISADLDNDIVLIEKEHIHITQNDRRLLNRSVKTILVAAFASKALSVT